MNSSRLRRAATAVAVLLCTAAEPLPAEGYVPPVDAPISEPFRAPPNPFGPGNRGVDYDTASGDPIRASADGEVVFAGQVAGSLHVTLLHDDGIRTSYSFVQTIDVVAGQQVSQGDRIATAGNSFHFGARRGDDYFDPTTLFGARSPDTEVELLPFEVPPGSRPDAERAALVQLAFDDEDDGFVSLPGLDTLAGLVAGPALPLDYRIQLDPARVFDDLVDLASRLSDPPPCSDFAAPRQPVARQRRQALLVGGLGSSVASASINDLRTDELGYSADAVTRLDYDSTGDLPAAGSRLADRVEALAAAHPGATIDLYGHSMGGVVVRVGLAELKWRHFDLSRLGLVATIASPHQGADLATDAVKGGIWSDVPAVASLAEGSRMMTDLTQVDVPDGVQFLSIGVSGDVVVPAPKTIVPGATNVTVAGAGREVHGDVVSSDEVTHEVAKALAGLPPTCEDPGEVVEEYLTGHTVSYAEDVLGFAVFTRPG